MLNVLVDAAGTVTCQSVIRGLRGAEGKVNKIVTIDMDPKNAGRFLSDRFYLCPRADSEEYIDFLLDLFDEELINVFIPIIDSGLLNVSKHIDRFPDNVAVIVSPYSTIKMCDNKAETSLMFKKAGLATPKTYVHKKDINKYPVFVKPLYGGRASLGCYKVDSEEELDIVLTKDKEAKLVMDYIEGQEYTIDVVCNMDGSYIASLPRKRLETKSGVSYKAEIVHNQELTDSVIKLVNSTDFFGPLNVQCIEDIEGKFWFIEVNPRFSGTLAATISAGLNTVDILLEYLTNPEVIKTKSFDYNDGTFLRYWSDVFIDKGVLPME